MKIFKTLIVLFLFLGAFNVNAQKVKIKKGIAYVDKKKFLKVEKVNSTKYFISTLTDTEFLSIALESFGTGKYAPARYGGNEYKKWYSVLKFLDNEEIGDEFEVDEGKLKNVIKILYKSKVIVDGKLSVDKVKRMIEKYSEKVSERRFLTKN